MMIVADENIPFCRDAFSVLGEVRRMGGRAIDRAAVSDAELLLVRSVTPVGAELLEGSRVRFVATATIGTDHVDLDYLRQRGIAFSAAPGSNARSVAEYVAAALLVLESRGLIRVEGSTLGVVGVGNVGSRVARVAEALGMKVLLNDPPRSRAEGGGGFVELDRLLAESDVVTFHVPLEKAGTDPTWHMIDSALLSRLRPGAALLNSSRGAVADTSALKEAKRAGRLSALALDVWEGEPVVDAELLAMTEIATPHIAGYSYDGKVAGTRMIYEAAIRHLGEGPAWPDGLPPAEPLEVTLTEPSIMGAVMASYDIVADDARMREAHRAASPEERGRAFDHLRKTYPRRREFANWTVRVNPGADAVSDRLSRLGFRVETAE